MIWVRVELTDDLYQFLIDQVGTKAGNTFSDVLNYFLEIGCRRKDLD